MKAERLQWKKGDFLALFFVLALAVGLLLWFTLSAGNRSAATVQAYQNGQLLWEKPLNVDGTYEIIGDYQNQVTVRDGKVAITSSTCPGEDCVHQGFCSTPGRSIVCLPNRVELRLTGFGEYDIVVG